jgi:hypothetical protein
LIKPEVTAPKVVAPAVREKRFAFEAKRFVEEAVVAKNDVEVAFEVVALSPVKF